MSGTPELNREFLRPERSAITIRPVPDASIIVQGPILCYNRPRKNLHEKGDFQDAT